jgi:hypothetical protein
MNDLSEYVRFKDLRAELTNYARRDMAILIERGRVVLPGNISGPAKMLLIGLLVLAIKALL